MVLKSVLLILDLLVPDHRKVALDVSLCLVSVREHLEVGPAELPGQHVRLRLHQRVFLAQELLADHISTEARLDHQRRRLFHQALLPVVVGARDKAFDR